MLQQQQPSVEGEFYPALPVVSQLAVYAGTLPVASDTGLLLYV
jgi:hypothetical protein